MLKGDFTIIAVLFFLAGLVYLAVRKRKFFYLTISLIVLNLIPILLYEKTATHFYLTSMVVFFCLPFACGLAWLKEGIVLFYIKFIKPGISKRAAFLSLPQNTSNLTQCRKRKFIALKTVFFLFFFIAVTLFPLHLFAANFKAMDRSRDTYEYDYWAAAIESMKDDSIIISNSLTAHIPIYIDKFETGKNIEIIRNVDLDQIRAIVKENIGKRDIYYTDSYLPDLSQYFSVETYGTRFYKKDFRESFLIYKINDIKVDLIITAEPEKLDIDFGRKQTLVFTIQNNSKNILSMTSVELELPKALKLLQMDKSSDMESPPGLARGIYMWTAGPYQVQPGSAYKVALLVQADAKAHDEIKFRITTGNMYVEGPSVEVSIK
ncbi:MAG: hypothetical protein BWY60_00487 [Actinobacteria bacterium ADurb.Bin346]|nr:MAG: hypothetical protein BWY60_00487 [Actinobacteria bacterium ADurb.Bin346]